MNRRRYLQLACGAGIAGLAGCLDRLVPSDPVLPVEKLVAASDPNDSPPRNIQVLFRYETGEGHLRYAESRRSPMYDGTAEDLPFVSPPDDDEPLFVDEAFHSWLAGRFEDVRYSVHVCAKGLHEPGEVGCLSHRLDRSDFNEFTLEDAIVLREGSEEFEVVRVHKGEGMRSEIEDASSAGNLH